jgi:hypothetical protein
MERLLWKNYPAGLINEKIEFWVDMWDDLIDHFTKTHYGLELVNPHVVLIVLIDEIEHNELRNKETRQYLLESIAHFLNNDPVVKQHLRAEFSLLLNGFNNQPHFYLLQSAKAVLPFFRDGKYFFETYSKLRQILADPNWQPKEEKNIETIANSLIVELLLKGYSLKSIREMPRNLFDDVSRSGNKFPKEYTYFDLIELPDAERDKHLAKQADELKTLNVDNRLSAFTRYSTRKPYDFIFIYEVEGLKGEGQLEIGPVTFYSPKTISLIKPDSADAKTNDLLKEEEFFRRNKNQYFANAAIKLSCVDVDNGLILAAEMADKALDLLRSGHQSQCRFKIAREQYVYLRKNGHLGGSGTSVGDDDPILKWQHSIDLKYFSANKDGLTTLENTGEYLFLAKDAQSILEQKVSDCLHWFRKGEETDRLEDRLLHYWIVIEKIFTFHTSSAPLIKAADKHEPKIFLISELLPAISAFGFIYSNGWTLHRYLKHLLGTLAVFYDNSSLKLSKEIIEKCYLQENYIGVIYLKQIVENLDELEKAVDKRLVKNRIKNAKLFYQDGEFAKEEIKQIIARTKEDVFLIYRYRNSIVHNAHYDPSLLKPFVEKAASLAQTALNLLITERSKSPAATVEQIFISKHIEVQRILERLDKKLPVDFLDVPTWNAPSP